MIVFLLLILLTVGAGGTSLGTANAEIRIRVDGEFIPIRYGQPPVLIESRTLVPLRDVMTGLGFTVEWDYDTRIAHLEKPGYIVSVPLDGDTMTVNGEIIPLEVPARAMNNRIMLPIRAISEATGMHVYWIHEARIVDIRTEGQGKLTAPHRISWQFSTYRAPDFRAERVESHSPQTVDVLYVSASGWALIHTERGNQWVYLRENMRFIERPTGLFENREDTRWLEILSPDVVRILRQEGSWIQISTWLGPRWLNLDAPLIPQTDELDALLRRWGNQVAVYFENIETGFVYTFNPDRIYHGASVPKATFSMYIYQMADRGETNLDSRHRFRGGTLTQREMLRRNLMYSCNDSTLALRDVHGIVGYRRWIYDLGGNPDWAANRIMGSRLTANEAGLFARAIYDYIESDAPHAAEFRTNLLNNRIPFIVSDYPIASKTGWTSQVMHDMAIVYADSPYILVILSSRINQAAFREISMAFQQFNDRWFVW